MLSFIRSHFRYSFVSFIYLCYLAVINRASYMSIYVDLLFIFFIWFIYKPFKYSFGNKIVIFKFLFILMLINGVLHGNQFVYMLQDIVYLMPILPIVLRSPNFRNDFLHNQLEGYKRLLPFLILLYFLIFEYMEYSWIGSVDARFSYNRDSKLLLFAPLTPLSYIPVLLAFTNFQGSKTTKICIFLGFFAFLHMGFFTQTKSTFLGPIVILLLRLFISFNIVSKLKSAFVLALFSSLIIYVLNLYMPELLELFFNKFYVVDDSNTSRLDESIQYLNKCNLFEILFGKGFGGIKVFHGESFIGGINMLHMGSGFLIMKGGILLLLIFYLPLLYVVVKDYIEKKYVFVILALYFLYKDQTHTNFTSLSGSLLYWFLVYCRFYYRKQFNIILSHWK